MDCHALLQEIFLTQGLNLCLLLGRQILYCWATWEAQWSGEQPCLWKEVPACPAHRAQPLKHPSSTRPEAHLTGAAQTLKQSAQLWFRTDSVLKIRLIRLSKAAIYFCDTSPFFSCILQSEKNHCFRKTWCQITSSLENTLGRFVLTSCISLGEEGMSRDINCVRKKRKARLVIFIWFEGDINKTVPRILWGLIYWGRIAQKSKRPDFPILAFHPLARPLAGCVTSGHRPVQVLGMQMSRWD